MAGVGPRTPSHGGAGTRLRAPLRHGDGHRSRLQTDVLRRRRRKETDERGERGTRESQPLVRKGGGGAISTGPSTAQRRSATEQADSAQRPERGERVPSGESAA
ncbi:unnamed protein product [Boreogadus saida]